jgi:hypothetical protein
MYLPFILIICFVFLSATHGQRALLARTLAGQSIVFNVM